MAQLLSGPAPALEQTDQAGAPQLGQGGWEVLQGAVAAAEAAACPFPLITRLITSLRRESVGATPQHSQVAELTEASATALREALEGEDLESALAAQDHLLSHLIDLAALWGAARTADGPGS